MKKNVVELDNQRYSYVLSIIDCFSRFLWLRALTNKQSKTVAEKIEQIHLEFGPPKMIHTDRGPEFQGAVKELASKLNISMVHSRPYYPQSQGKIERSHSTWKCKPSKHEELLQSLSTEKKNGHNVALIKSVSVSVSAQDGIVALGMAHTHSAPSLSSLPKVALESVPIFAWLNTDSPRP